MKIYHYNSRTLDYIGQSDAKTDPENEGEFLIPSNATTIPPKEDVPENHSNVFRGGEWVIELDLRGTFYVMPDGRESMIGKLGQQLPDGAQVIEMEPEPTPQPPQKPQSCTPRQARLALNELGERDIVESAVAASSRDVQDSWEYSTVYKRTDPMIIMLSSGLGWDDNKIDELFALAITK